MSKNNKFVFRKQDKVGLSDAEDDKEFLLKCFIDTGDYKILMDYSDPACLILGRTGTGKTALLTKLKNENKGNCVITINPESLAMQHISNPNIIRYMFDLGINLNTFFKLLWRHAICVEIFQHHFKVINETDNQDLIERLRYKFRKTNPRHYRSLNYLEEWKDTFWKEDDHVVGMINKTESELSGSVGSSKLPITGRLSSSSKMTEEERHDIKKRAQEVVDKVQMKEVTSLLGMLNEVIEDQQKKYYLVIDKLDEHWVEDELRYYLIKALIETVRDVNRFENIKPLVALRLDLLDHVFNITKDTGFQEEKYKSLYLQIKWTRQQLIDLIDRRLDLLLKSRYSKKTQITHCDVLPDFVDGQPSIDFILDRTLLRPRDIISFFNYCIEESVDGDSITYEAIIRAERKYSYERLKSINYEWFTEFPNIKFWAECLRGYDSIFQVQNLSDHFIEEKCVEYIANFSKDKRVVERDSIFELASGVVEGRLQAPQFRKHLIYIFYITGILGIKLKGQDNVLWSFISGDAVTPEDIEDGQRVVIQTSFRSALNVRGHQS